MWRIEQLHNLALAQLLLEFLILVLHSRVFVPPIWKTEIRVILVRFQVTAELVMRRQLGRIFGEFLHALKGSLLISQILFIGVFLFLAEWTAVYFLKVSIMGWKLVVSM